MLAGLAGVREAVVVTMDSGGARSLAGFYTRRPAGPSADVVRAALADRLPEYMVRQPDLLPELPLTVNGSV